MTADAITKLETAQTNLQAVQASIKMYKNMLLKLINLDLKLILQVNLDLECHQYPEPIDIEPFVIEGFENIQGFAPAF
jgi:hypothetical protein